jgi:hypothetical protein
MCPYDNELPAARKKPPARFLVREIEALNPIDGTDLTETAPRRTNTDAIQELFQEIMIRQCPGKTLFTMPGRTDSSKKEIENYSSPDNQRPEMAITMRNSFFPLKLSVLTLVSEIVLLTQFMK